ncbi:hypothetical protein [Leifsonia sp. LS-T14]|uniref:hypothetical protein n=1 Tax=unclassified Leifsonia TaxID=2663824 RepID=UPI0035A6BE4C
MYAGPTMPPMAAGGVLAATGANTTLGIILVALALLIGGALLLRDRLLNRRARVE